MDLGMTIFSILVLVELVFIASVMLSRNRNRKFKSVSALEFDNTAPFEVPFAVDSRLRAVSYEEVVPNFRIGFDARHGSVISLSQVARTPSNRDAVTQSYVLSIFLEELRGCEWITIERATEPLAHSGMYKFLLSIRARSFGQSMLTAEIGIPKTNEEDHRVAIGAMSLTQEFQLFTLSAQLDGGVLSNVDPFRNSRVILFLPLTEGITIDFEELEIQIEKI